MLRIFLFSLFIITQQCWAAGFGINATRLIYPEEANSIATELRNTLNNEPLLVQVGVSSKADTRTSAPFLVTPPLFRLEPQSINQVRIAYNGAALPHDRESVFYLHATAIAASKLSEKNQSQVDVQANARFGVGSVIKLFFRPVGLRGSSADAQNNLQFSRETGGLRVINPSSYYISFAGVQVSGSWLPLTEPGALMLAPGSSYTWPVKAPLSAGSQVRWQTINDSGIHNDHSATLP